MYTAMRKEMEGTVKKKSAVLGRDADFKKTSPLSRLPGYLTVQFVRFSVGKAPDSGETVARKILKDVKYTMKLDMYEFCTTELQQKLSPMRTKFKEQEEKKMTPPTAEETSDVPMETADSADPPPPPPTN
ncbi:Ubiquitin carboxyl-terminal hydrolase 14 [Geodia barretti]|uniref:ubiquitinyl hydrolase 1 n=1 Tax=Geodia barretti TaxID=519541 RepID=A0AA35U0Z5_GEOBA|nr:Ubiquitin carboxyl-terminal hydrolase 14 [Geodia barretti]